jgi:hypothetical protein
LRDLIRLLERLDGERLFEEGKQSRSSSVASSSSENSLLLDALDGLYDGVDDEKKILQKGEDVSHLDSANDLMNNRNVNDDDNDETAKIIRQISLRMQTAMEQELVAIRSDLLARKRR